MTSLTLAILLPFASLPLFWAFSRGGNRTGWIAVAVSAGSLILIGAAAGDATAFTARMASWPWVPALGVRWTLLADGLSLFYGLVAAGMGGLVGIYAVAYLRKHEHGHARFYACLMLFLGSMLGTVFAGNLLVLVVFWELTGVASFLLIGFEHEDGEARVAARTALLVTGGTGLAMLAGVALLGLRAGTLDLPTLLASPPGGADAELTLILLLIAVGVFGKSAQFPFHFWLPKAMAAPTPVSAYLHTATMVNLGVFLTARLYPMFADIASWTPVLVGVGFFTMVAGAAAALCSSDLKAVLAYATVSQLGAFLGSYGWQTHGVSHDLAHVFDHVLYKGGLFMVAGIIAQVTGSRELEAMRGVGRHRPWIGVVFVVGAAVLAGAPGTLGYVATRETLAEAWVYLEEGTFWPAYPLVTVIAASALNVAIGARLVAVALGRSEGGAEKAWGRPGVLIQLPGTVLVAAAVLFGLWPQGLSAGLERFLVSGVHRPEPEPWHLWAGVDRAVLTWAAVGLAGMGVFALGRATRWRWAQIPRGLRFDRGFDWVVTVVRRGSLRGTAAVGTDRPMVYLPVSILALVGLVGGWLAWRSDALGLTVQSVTAAGWPDPLRSTVVLIVGVALLLVVNLRAWPGQVIALSITGFLLTFYYVLFRAPDLAMTQILIDSVSLILTLCLLVRFSHAAERGEKRTQPRPLRRTFDIALSTAFGLCLAALTYIGASARRPGAVGERYLQASEPEAHAKNVVNAILVDFRGLDTLFETTVVLTAALGAVGLFMRYRRGPNEDVAGARLRATVGGDELSKEEGR